MSLKEKFYALNSETDNCFAKDENELNECNRMCTGHGCPKWEEHAVKCEKIAQNYMRNCLIDELKKHIEHPTKPGYKRSDIINRIKELETSIQK